MLAMHDARALVSDNGVIKNGDPKNAEGIKFDFRQGSMLLKASYGQPINIAEIPEVERAALRVDPGEVVFITTEEVLALPSNMMVFLSPKRGLMQSGILTLGGGVVDPGYHGVLWIGLYNLSSTAFPLRRGRKVIAGVFHQLAPGEQPIPTSDPIVEFPDELITTIQNYKPVELRLLQERVEALQRQIQNLSESITEDQTWKQEFKTGLKEQGERIDKLITGLEAEKNARTEEDKRMEARLSRLDSRFLGVKWSWGIILLVAGSAVTILVQQFVQRLLP
jgi:hypothetical protein